MAKRMRRSSPDEESSDSQGRLDVDEQQSRSSSEASRSPQAQAPLPLKKKRTRTLTTPHQSAVLHALLAQSRFPTTAMREEVGRAIGLSARKVQVSSLSLAIASTFLTTGPRLRVLFQIWFQNQRQKARRPGAQQQQQQPGHTQSGLVATQPYPNYPNLLAPAPGAYPPAPPYGGYPPPDASLDASGAHLLGPGMPGPSTTAPRQRGRPISHVSPTEYSHEMAASSSYSPRASRSAENILPPLRPRQHDPARTLPPLDFTQPTRRSEHSPSSSYLLGASAPPTPFQTSPPQTATTSSFLARSSSRSPSPPFAHSLPPPGLEHALPSYSSIAMGLPPPFTLQPQLQWTGRRLSGPSTSSSSSSWSQAGPSTASSSRVRSPSPDDDRTPRLGAAQAPGASTSAAAASSSRAGRYDPVRGGFISPANTPSPPP
ncbi:Homeobox-domain-containing protein [Mycena chlorophos]|uniref:Homeobox-domain-containing protein n=1 Tax=Mycena chlorophos TaxID=658473 RepID=A0A8H6W898_MYCCL|nr:Homeobox-domain-containing protein [Mycena chlorophos]